jgi:hypothetical protein
MASAAFSQAEGWSVPFMLWPLAALFSFWSVWFCWLMLYCIYVLCFFYGTGCEVALLVFATGRILVSGGLSWPEIFFACF